jgi:hypothetical protein
VSAISNRKFATWLSAPLPKEKIKAFGFGIFSRLSEKIIS